MQRIIYITLIIATFSAKAGNNLPLYRNTPELIELCLVYKEQPIFSQLCDVLFDSLSEKDHLYRVPSTMLYKDKNNILKNVQFRLAEPQFSDFSISHFFINLSNDSISFRTLFSNQEIHFQHSKSSIREIQELYCRTKKKIIHNIRPFEKDSLKNKSLFRVNLNISNKTRLSTNTWENYFNILNIIYLTNKFIMNDISERKYCKHFNELSVYQKNVVMTLSDFWVQLVFLIDS